MSSTLNLLKTYRETLIAFAVIIVIGASISLLLDNWTRSIVAVNTEQTQQTVRRLAEASGPLVDSLWHAGFFQKTELTRGQSRTVDSLFARLTAAEARAVVGMEGGFYLHTCNEMLGYSWPTSPPPAPAYGPAPRSYQIIRDQLMQSFVRRTPLTEFHQFDVATFPLATAPLLHEQEVIGSVWARIHVERELPSSRIGRWLNIALGIMVVVLVVFSVFSWRQRKLVDQIRTDLELIHSEPAHRLPEARGVFGSISRSINALVDTQQDDQRRREQLERELHQQDKMATLGRLVAGVAHEVKTPLAAIKTRIQMWQRDVRQLGPNAPAGDIVSEDSLQLLIKEINRLSALVKRLLIFSRPVGSHTKPTDVNALIRQSLSLLEGDAGTAHIEIQAHLDPAVPRIPLDPNAFEQVLLNICTNAIDAMPDGGRLDVRSASEIDRHMVRITIADSGTGLSPEVREKVFEPFYTTKENGVGLGLYISHEIVRTLGGTISFLDGGGAGTVCVIDLPANSGRKEHV